MTNTEAPAPRISEYDKVAALVTVETAMKTVGYYAGPITPAIQVNIDAGFLMTWPDNLVVPTSAGWKRLAGFRALLAPAD